MLHDLDEALETRRGHYAHEHSRSRELAAEAAEVLPAGSTRSVLDFEPFSFRVDHASGAELFDVDGHRYVDLLGDYSAGLLGHDPRFVVEAVAGAMAKGWAYGGVHPDEARLAHHLVDRFPALEQVRFTNSGTEANLMAISLARHVTGRSNVAVFDGAYHGGLLYFGHGGEALLAPYPFVRATYNDLASVERTLAGGDVACLMVEPMMGAAGCIPAAEGFLAHVGAVCDHHDTLLVFDEVMTSRMAMGGAQQRTGVIPDLMTLGKYAGGGLSFGAFGGRRELMAAFDPARGGSLSHGGTFNNNRASMAAGVAVQHEMIDAVSLDGLFDRGERLRARLGELFATSPLPLSVTGWGSLMNIHATKRPISNPSDLEGSDLRLKEILFFDLLERGYFFAPRGYIALSLAVTDEMLDGFVAATGEVLARLT